MLGYVPPFQALPLLAPKYKVGESNGLLQAMILDSASLPICPRSVETVAPIAAVTDLIRLHGTSANMDGYTGLDAMTLKGVVHEALGITAKTWPLSLASACQALTPAKDGAMVRVAVDSMVLGPIPDPPVVGDAPVTTTFQGSSVPISRHIYKMCLASGYYVALGLAIGESWHDLKSAVDGTVRIPQPDDVLYDGTCVVLVGWDDDRQAFRFRSTQGPDWGDHGMGWIPYEYAARHEWCPEAVILIL